MKLRMSYPMDMTVSIKREPEDHLYLNQSVESRVKMRMSPRKREDHLDINQPVYFRVKKSSPRPARTVSVKQEPEDHLDIKHPVYFRVKKSSPVPARTVSVEQEPEDHLDINTDHQLRTVSVEQEPEDHLDINTDHQLTLQQDRTDELLTCKSIWIVGSSILAQAQPRVVQTLGRHFGLPAEVSWLLKRDMRWRDVIPTVQEQLSTSPPPDILLIHAGGNDLGKESRLKLVQRMKAELFWLHSRYKDIKIVFSSIVARQRWMGARNPFKINKARGWVNCEMARFVRGLSGAVIEHRNFKYIHPGVFLQDGVHFTNRGKDIFIDDLYNGLRRLY